MEIKESTVEKYKVYARKFKLALTIFGVTLVIFVLLISKTVPQIQKISSIQSQTKTESSSLADLERKLTELKKSQEEKIKEDNSVVKAFFKPISSVPDTEAAISDEFAEILQLMRENKIKARSIKNVPDPDDDNFVKFAGNRYYVCRVSAEMIANYTDFENFLRDLYKHEHFLEISKIEIVPYQKNKRILLISLQIKLYAQRDPSTVVNQPAPQPAAEAAPKPAESAANNVAPAQQQESSPDDF